VIETNCGPPEMGPRVLSECSFGLDMQLQPTM
jgi:hypothetical protein